jgi:hypothetical protein
MSTAHSTKVGRQSVRFNKELVLLFLSLSLCYETDNNVNEKKRRAALNCCVYKRELENSEKKDISI